MSAATIAAAQPDFSPDGKQIITEWVGGSGGSRLVLIGTDGKGGKHIPDIGIFPTWSPNGKKIVFWNQSNSTTNIYIVESGKCIMPAGLAATLKPPYVWREDSARFAGLVVSPSEKKEEKTKIAYYDTVELGISLLRPLPCSPNMQRMIWIPGTDNLAFIGTEGGTKANVYVMESGETRKITTSDDVIGLGITPDGKRLLWARRSNNTRYILFTVYAYSLDDRAVQRLDFPVRIPEINLTPQKAPDHVDCVTFAPSGDRLAFVTSTQQPATKESPVPRTLYECWTMTIDGRNAVRILSDNSNLISGVPNVLRPAWSANSGQIAVTAVVEDRLRLVLHDVAMRQTRLLSDSRNPIVGK